MIAEVIIDSKAKKLNRKFDYEIPKNLEDIIEIGSRVLVPLTSTAHPTTHFPARYGQP